jgi:hypothetical protein
MSNNFNVLVATDYFESAMTAEKYAIDFAACTGSFLTFLHIYDFSAATTRGTAADIAKHKIKFHESKLEEGFLERVLIPDVSVTKKMSSNIRIPLLCVPDYYDPAYSKLWKIFEPDVEKSLNEF